MPAPTRPPRYAPEIPLPPYAYVPGNGLPHPVNEPGGHSYGHASQLPPLQPDAFTQLPADPSSPRRTLAAILAADPRWSHALDLFNEGFCWEAHETWEQFWHALGRTTPEARFVQGLIHLAAAAVKIREGKPAGFTKHAQRAWELLGGSGATGEGGAAEGRDLEAAAQTLGLDSASLGAVLTELDAYRPECWHMPRFPVVKVLAAGVQKPKTRGRAIAWPKPNPAFKPLSGQTRSAVPEARIFAFLRKQGRPVGLLRARPVARHT